MDTSVEATVKGSKDALEFVSDEISDRATKDALGLLSRLAGVAASVKKFDQLDQLDKLDQLDQIEPSDTEPDEPSDSPKRKRIMCPIGKKARRRRRVSGPMVGVKIDSDTKRRLCRVKAFVEFASGEGYMMSDLMARVVSKGLDAVERELKLVDSSTDITANSPIDVKQTEPTEQTEPIEPTEPTEKAEGLS